MLIFHIRLILQKVISYEILLKYFLSQILIFPIGILDTILSVQPKESAGGKPGETRENIVYKIAEDMLRKLPRDYVPHEVKESLVRLGGLLPMNIFLRQEIDRIQKILTMGKYV